MLDSPPGVGCVRLARAECVAVHQVVTLATQMSFHVEVDGILCREHGALRLQVGLEIAAERVVAVVEHQIIRMHKLRSRLFQVPKRAHAAAAHRVEHTHALRLAAALRGVDGEGEHAQVTDDP